MAMTATRYWLMKSEPQECSIDHALAMPDRTVPWTGVRNYQARNFMRDAMRVGDGVLFYHSSCPEPGIAGLARVASGTRPDPTQFDPGSPYFDGASKPEAPRWLLLDVQVERKTRLIGLPALRADPALTEMLLLRRGNRLSVIPVEPAHWQHVMALIDAPGLA
jgi:predicted RNA-binding protein with PUA-like domain